jgi:cyclase
MLRSRIIPILLIQNKGLVKTTKFCAPKYVGDPINAVRIFNEKEADELCIFDIDASVQGYKPDFSLIEKLAGECRMPLCYGGGISSAKDALTILSFGVEKVALSSNAVERPELVSEIAREAGAQSVAVVLDLKRTRFGGLKLTTHNASVSHSKDPLEFAVQMEAMGAGEIILNFVDLDGTMGGYDIKSVKKFRDRLSIPITVAGGCGSSDDLRNLMVEFGPIGCAAGSYFVFKGKYKAVLISYPNASEKRAFFAKSGGQ